MQGRSAYQYEINLFAVIGLYLPGDSGETQLRSICLKFAGPIIGITRHLQGRCLSDEYIAPADGKTNLSHWILEFVVHIDCSIFSFI